MESIEYNVDLMDDESEDLVLEIGKVLKKNYNGKILKITNLC